jgi:hypothetical protein
MRLSNTTFLMRPSGWVGTAGRAVQSVEFRVAASRLSLVGRRRQRNGVKKPGIKEPGTKLKERPDSCESTDARAALPQNCSLVRLRPLRLPVNSTDVLFCPHQRATRFPQRNRTGSVRRCPVVSAREKRLQENTLGSGAEAMMAGRGGSETALKLWEIGVWLRKPNDDSEKRQASDSRRSRCI